MPKSPGSAEPGDFGICNKEKYQRRIELYYITTQDW